MLPYEVEVCALSFLVRSGKTLSVPFGTTQQKYETTSLYNPFSISLFETFVCCLQQNENRYSLTMGSTLNYQSEDQIITTLSVVLLSQPTLNTHLC
jgi:hypothetical protein